MKNILLPLMLFAPILLLAIGCGGNEDETQQRMEDLVGRWEFVSFGEQSVDERVNAFFNETGVTVNLMKNSLVFEQDGSWSLEIGGEFVGDLRNIIEAASLTQAEVAFSEKGTYFISASALSLVPQDISLRVTPQIFWLLVGTTEEDFAQKFRSDVFGTIYAFSWTIEGDILILTESESGEETVVGKKQTSER